MAEVLLNKLAACRERIAKILGKLPFDAASIRYNELLEAFLSFQIFLLIQDASDIGNHVVAAKGLGVPASQREAFDLYRAGRSPVAGAVGSTRASLSLESPT